MSGQAESAPARDHDGRYWLRYGVLLAVVGFVYVALAKASLALASINPSATPIWPPTGFALAVMMLAGYRVWPAILVGAFIANLTTAGSLTTSLAIAFGNTAESVVAAYFINRWSNGIATFDTPAGVGRFAVIGVLPGAAISATIGVASLVLAGFAEPAKIVPIWLTWWMGDLAGGLLIAPVVVLAVTAPPRPRSGRAMARSAALFAAAIIVGLAAFSPLALQIGNSAPLAFLSIVPLMWAALYHDQRDTAITALILACFAVWGALAGSGPFPQASLNEAFLVLLAFMISVSLPSLALSANVATRDRHQRDIETVMLELSHRSKNLLSVVQSIGRQVARHTKSFGDFDDAFAARIQALAQMHDLLITREWQGAEIREVLRMQLAPFLQPDDSRLRFEGPELVLRPKAVEQIGLLIHELATNSTKYGSLSAPAGKVNVSWAIEDKDATPHRLRLDWRESDGPNVSAPSQNGFGHLVITHLVPRALGGDGGLDFAPDGLRCTLDVPAANIIVANAADARLRRSWQAR